MQCQSGCLVIVQIIQGKLADNVAHAQPHLREQMSSFGRSYYGRVDANMKESIFSPLQARSKKEAKQRAAAALLEALLSEVPFHDLLYRAHNSQYDPKVCKALPSSLLLE